MPSSASVLTFDTDFDPQTGRPVTIMPGLQRITAPNASAFTFTGTNSFLVGDKALAVIDPGPNHDDHLAALLEAIDERPVEAIILTHTHKDHSALVPRLAAATGAPVWFGGQHRLSRPKGLFEINPIAGSCDWGSVPDRRLVDGDVLHFGAIALEVITTPGHCANHLAFGVCDTPYLLSGDHVMGWNSTLVAVPDGSMADYFASLDKLLDREWSHYLPAHGGPIADAPAYVRHLRAHRAHRNTQILDALSAGALTADDLRRHIYPHLPAANLVAAGMTLKAHLEYLEELNQVRSRPALGGRRYSRLT